MSERNAKVSKNLEIATLAQVDRQQCRLSGERPLNTPVDHILFLQRTIGNQAMESLFRSGAIQAKLEVGRPNDIYEPLGDQFAPESTVQCDSEPVKPNNTGLPDDLKAGVEFLSGMSLNHVNVHYNSSQPAQLNALAYAQGGDIHVAPGQERHLPHEAWHVVQQAQGRVQPTMQMKDGVPVNDDVRLEHEADVMGGRALQTKAFQVDSFESVKSAGLTNLMPPIQKQAKAQVKPGADHTALELYTVQSGDSISVIAKKFRITVADLLKYNKPKLKQRQAHGEKISGFAAGEVIFIPPSASSPEAANIDIDRAKFESALKYAINKLEASKLHFGKFANPTCISREIETELKAENIRPGDLTEDELVDRIDYYTSVGKVPIDWKDEIPWAHSGQGKFVELAFWHVVVDTRQGVPSSCDPAGTVYAKLVQTKGTPAEALRELFDKLDELHFDCAEYIQVAHWYAMWVVLGDAGFNGKVAKSLKTTIGFQGLELKSHDSTGIVTRVRYRRKFPADHFTRIDDKKNIRETTTETLPSLLSKIPIGSRVMWTNLDADPKDRFTNENTKKTGDDKYASYPYGTGSGNYIRCRLAIPTYFTKVLNLCEDEEALAKACKDGNPPPDLDNYSKAKVFISEIDIFEL